MAIFSATSSTFCPSRWVSSRHPSVPACSKVLGLPAAVIQTGISFCTGRGSVRVSTRLPFGPGKATASPRHRRRTMSMRAIISSCRLANASGIRMKSFGCQPEAKEMPTRPFEMLSTKAQSSATRTGWCSGITQLPARICTREVMPAMAALVTTGLG